MDQDCNFQAVNTSGFESVEIANFSNHLVEFSINKTGSQEAILLCPNEHNVETSIIETSSTLELRICDRKTDSEPNDSMEKTEGFPKNTLVNETQYYHSENIDPSRINVALNPKDDPKDQVGNSALPITDFVHHQLKTDSESMQNSNTDQRKEYTYSISNEVLPIKTREINNQKCSELKSDASPMEVIDAAADEFEIYKPIEICSLVTGFTKEFHKENFFRGCKWAPDGTCLLTNSNDNYLRTFDLPSELHCKSKWRPSHESPRLNHSLKIREGGMVYDFVWYPKMNSMESFTSFFLCSSMNAPIHLWDSVGGEIQATYRPYNQVDEVTHAFSLAFSSNGRKIFSGFTSELKVFSTDIPGRQCTSRNLKPWFRKTIVSAIAVNPLHEDLCALGTYSGMIGLFTESDGKPCCFLKGHRGGITHLSFSPSGIQLYSGARMDGEILCWDLRNPGQVLYSFPRTVTTNQKIYFDLSPCSAYLLSGNTSGVVSIWNISSNLPSSPYEESAQHPLHEFTAHQDCTNGVAVHPFYSILGTTSGQRHISHEDGERRENNLKLWWIGR